MKSFAGFWRDGAVVKPEEKHLVDKYVVGIWKDSKHYDLFFHTNKKWHDVYWLDTTIPTELSPQEAFELIKIIYPNANRVTNDGEDIINWGDLTEYPPKQKWRVPTDADKGKKCRFGDDSSYVRDGMFLCVHPNGRFVVYYDKDFWLCKFCEVQDEV